MVIYFLFYSNLEYTHQLLTMDKHQNVDSSIRRTSFTQQINSLFSTSTHPAPSKLTQATSFAIAKMARFSCHISFLKRCRDHDFLPKGLRLKNPVANTKSDTILHSTGMQLLRERLSHYRRQYHNLKCSYEADIETLNDILDEEYYSILNNLNKQKSTSFHRKLLAKHQRKFQDLIRYYSVSFSNPYTKLVNFDITLPTFEGSIKITNLTLNSSNKVRNTVVNLYEVNISSN